MRRWVHYLFHLIAAAAFFAAGRCRRARSVVACAAVAGASVGYLHHDHADQERSYHTR